MQILKHCIILHMMYCPAFVINVAAPLWYGMDDLGWVGSDPQSTRNILRVTRYNYGLRAGVGNIVGYCNIIVTRRVRPVNKLLLFLV